MTTDEDTKPYCCPKCIGLELRLTMNLPDRAKGFIPGNIVNGECDRCTYQEKDEDDT